MLFRLLLLLIIPILAFGTTAIPIGGSFSNGGVAAIPDSARVTLSDYTDYDTSFLCAPTYAQWDTTINLPAESISGTWITVDMKTYFGNDSVLTSERYDIPQATASSGAYSLTIVTWDSVNSAAIPNATLTIQNTTLTTTLEHGKTNANGLRLFNVPNDSLQVTPYQYRFTFPGTYKYKISSNTVDTINASPLANPEPVTCEVYGYIFRPNSVSKSGITVRASINSNKVKLTRNNIPISPIWVTDTTDTNGYWTMNLYVSDSLSPATPWKIEALDSLSKPFNYTSVYVLDSVRQRILW